MSRIFISHSSHNNSIATYLKVRLKEEGYHSVFLDFDPFEGIPVGRNWEREIYSQLKVCQAMIVLCSEHSMTSPWCFAEITHAKALGKNIFPIKIESCQIVGLLTDFQVLDLTSMNDTEIYENLFISLKKMGLNPTASFDWNNIRPPYPGLMAFEADDAAIYFGREEDISQSLDFLNRYRMFGGNHFLLLLGASGCGKSSLMRAGILPRLKQYQEGWILLEPLRPFQEPFLALSKIFLVCFEQYDYSAEDIKCCAKLCNVDETLNNRIKTLIVILERLQLISGQGKVTILLMIDQFEDLLDDLSKSQKNKFLSFICAALNLVNSHLIILGTMRSDFLGIFQTNLALQSINYEIQTIKPLGFEGLAKVIQEPANFVGLELQSGLVELLINDTETGDALPLLAFTLREMWELHGKSGIITVENYKGMGGLETAISKAAQNLFESFATPRYSTRKQFENDVCNAFLKLVRINENGKIVAQLASWKEMPQSVKKLLEHFVNRRLLISSGIGQDQLLGLSHEILISSWPLLKRWILDSEDNLRQKQKIETAATEWSISMKSQDYLLTRKRLSEAKHFWNLQSKDFKLSYLAIEFIEASIKQQHINLWKIIFLILIAPSIATLILGLYLFRELKLNRSSQLIKNCELQEQCVGRHEALEEMVRANISLEKIDLGSTILTGIDLKDGNLKGANLSLANLSGARLIGANLSNANLRRIDLTGADLRMAILDNSDLYASTLINVNLSHANLKSHDLRSVLFTNANLSNADLSTAKMDKASIRGTNFNGANLTGADLSNVNLHSRLIAYSGKDYSTLQMTINFSGTNLSSANLTGADLYNSDFNETNLSGANLCGADLTEAKNLTPIQVMSAENWTEATYDDHFRAELDLTAIKSNFSQGNEKEVAECIKTNLQQLLEGK